MSESASSSRDADNRPPAECLPPTPDAPAEPSCACLRFARAAEGWVTTLALASMVVLLLSETVLGDFRPA